MKTLSTRALNRALLARQHLLRRVRRRVLDEVEWLVGLQAQAPNPPYLGLWTRLYGFRAEQLSQLLLERRVVRVALMRSTIHLVSTRDAYALRPLVQPVLERSLRGSDHGRGVEGIDMHALADVARRLVDAEPLTFTQLGARLRESFPDRNGTDLAAAARTALTLVQVTPRGVWGTSGAAAHTTLESWTQSEPGQPTTPQQLVLRYLAAFGPASARDVQVWSGLTKLAPVLDELRPQLRTFRSEHGAELFDLPDAPRPREDTVAPARFLPEFDNITLSHHDRARIISDERRRIIATSNGMVPGTLLIDGFVWARWRVERTRAAATLHIMPFARLDPAARQEAAQEGARLLSFMAPDLTPDVRFAAPSKAKAG